VNCFTAAIMSAAFLHGFAIAPASAQPVASGPTPVADNLLAEARGMADMRLVEQTTTIESTGTVEGNTINGDFTTGMVTLGNGALDNFNGLALFNINTGNNVAINSSMTVNVAIQP
jgi:opacity protein-like surface antigen